MIFEKLSYTKFWICPKNCKKSTTLSIFNTWTFYILFSKQKKYYVIFMMKFMQETSVDFETFKKMFFSFFSFLGAPAFSAYSNWELCEGFCQCISWFGGELSQNELFWGGSLLKNCLPTIGLKISNWILPTNVIKSERNLEKG